MRLVRLGSTSTSCSRDDPDGDPRSRRGSGDRHLVLASGNAWDRCLHKCRPLVASLPSARQEIPYPQVGHRLRGRPEDQGAEHGLRNHAHRALNQHRMDHARHDDHRYDSRMANTPRARSQSPPEYCEERSCENRPHGDHSPIGERGWRGEEQRVDYVGRTRDPEPRNMDDYRADEGGPYHPVNASPQPSRQTRQVPTRQKGLDEKKRHREHTGKSCRDVDRLSPRKQRAKRCNSNRHGNGGCYGEPDQGRFGSSHSLQTGRRTKSALRLVSLALDMTGRKKTVSKSSPS